MANDNAVPSAAERTAIERILRECEWHKDSTSTNAITLLPPIVRRLLAAVEALEADNARLREALGTDDRSVDASIAYLNSTSGGMKNEMPFPLAANDQADYHNQFIGEDESE